LVIGDRFSSYDELIVLTSLRRDKEDYYTIFPTFTSKKYRYLSLQIINSDPLKSLDVADILVYVVA